MANDSKRTTPEAIINTQLQPQASPVNQEIKYQPMLSDAKGTAATADALASLGTGALAFEDVLKDKAADSAIDAYTKTKVNEQNRKDWADVSKNIEGMAKFNPYIKDAYKTLVAQDAFKQSVVAIAAIPHPEKMSNEEYHNAISKIQDNLLQQYTNSGLNISSYAPFIEKFDTVKQQHLLQYTTANTAYNYEQYKTSAAADLGTDLGIYVSSDKGSMTTLTGNNEGLVQNGNIDLLTAPKVKNPNGTMNSMPLEIDGKTVLVPAVNDTGKAVTTDEAIATYRQTGKNLGVFNSKEAAEKYAVRLSNHQTAISMTDTTGLEGTTAGTAKKLGSVINSKIEQMTADGTPKDDQAAIIAGGLATYVINHADNLDSLAIKTAAKSIRIDGKSMDELIEGFDYKLDQMVKQAKRSNYEDLQADYQYKELQLKINTDKATTEYFQWFKTNQNASPAQQQAKAFEFINKYGIDQNGTSFLGTVATNKNTIQSIKEVESDPDVMRNLTYKAATGTLTGTQIGNAVMSGVINYKDGFQLTDRLTRVTNADVAYYDSTTKEILKGFTDKKGGEYYKYKDTGIYTSTQSALEDIGNQLDAGKITAQQARQMATGIRRSIPKAVEEYSKVNKNVSCILDSSYIHTQNLTTGYTPATLKSFQKMGITRNAQGSPEKNVSIASAPSKARTIDGKTNIHTGYDLSGVYNGKPIYSPMNGTVVAIGHNNPTMGNYIVVKCDNGKYMKAMHLNGFAKGISNGSKVNSNVAMAYVGNTGHVQKGTAASLHVEFWNQNFKWIPAERFY